MAKFEELKYKDKNKDLLIQANTKRIGTLPEPQGKYEISDGQNWYSIATEAWVTNQISGGLACNMGTTTALAATYTPGQTTGNLGIGATLTATTLQEDGLAIDGVAAVVGQRVLVKDQTDTTQNGIYDVTNIGSSTVAWVLTRSTDFNTASEMIPGDVIYIISGTINAVTSWMLTSTVVTVDTDPIVFTKTADSGITSILNVADQTTATVSGNVATIGLADNPVIPGTASLTIPAGTTDDRPTTITAGMIRWNTSILPPPSSNMN